MSKIVIIYHSGYGHTAKHAEAVAKGAKAELVAIDAQGNLTDAQWDTVSKADAIIFGSPTYMGSVSWQFKKFTDDTSHRIWGKQLWRNKIFAGFTNSAAMNGDKLSALMYMMIFANQHGGIWVSSGLPAASTKAAQRNDVNHLGSFSGAMFQTPADASVDEVVPGDLETARLFGERVAAVAAQFNK
jgi:NAD(P)H dehydrogenase (quinone)